MENQGHQSLPEELSGRDIGSFPYVTVKDRLPVILTKVLDNLCREREELKRQYGDGEGVREDLKKIIGQLSELKNHIQTDKSIRCVQKTSFKFDDYQIWADAIEAYVSEKGEYPRWFRTSWLFVECFMYKRIHDIFQTSQFFSSYDPFSKGKKSSLTGGHLSCGSLLNYTNDIINTKSNLDESQQKSIFTNVLKISLWGNRCDLSISAGSELNQDKDMLLLLGEYEDYILADDVDAIWAHLSQFSYLPPSKRSIGIILDNAGFELVSDLCLATVLVELGIVTSVSFYPKTRPWFVSDTMLTDFEYTLETLRTDFGQHNLVDLWQHYLSSGRWTLRERKFWTTPHDFDKMKSIDPELYAELESFQLLIFKGDLNYRKLVGDFKWPITTPIGDALRGFLPSPLAILRTIKGGAVVGLQMTDNVLKAQNTLNWTFSGEFGCIQFWSKE